MTGMGLLPPAYGDTWVALVCEPLPADTVAHWVVLPGCGAVVVFLGTVRDHAEGRPGVSSLAYEAYEEEVGPRLDGIVATARSSWPEIGRAAVLHRTGELGISDVSVVVAVSAPHRGEAFEAARFCIDSLKATVPIWKRETWDGGQDWSEAAHPIADLAVRQ
jgi:molybdopterin synthase catalytic subunit